MKLTRIRPRPVGRAATRYSALPDEDRLGYLHPNGYVIFRQTRDWNYGAGAIGAAGFMDKVGWFVFKAKEQPQYHAGVYAGMSVFDGRTLRECRAWCDEHPSGRL